MNSALCQFDFADPEANQYVVTTQFTIRAGGSEKRATVVRLSDSA